jgi:ABC-type cobalamin transport system permease subunit
MIIGLCCRSILRTVFETEAETLILPLAFDLTEKAQTRILPLVTENCPDYWQISAICGAWVLSFADFLARLGAVELPVGTVTAFLGSPLFVWLLYRRSSY